MRYYLIENKFTQPLMFLNYTFDQVRCSVGYNDVQLFDII